MPPSPPGPGGRISGVAGVGEILKTEILASCPPSERGQLGAQFFIFPVFQFPAPNTANRKPAPPRTPGVIPDHAQVRSHSAPDCPALGCFPCEWTPGPGCPRRPAEATCIATSVRDSNWYYKMKKSLSTNFQLAVSSARIGFRLIAIDPVIQEGHPRWSPKCSFCCDLRVSR